MDPEQASILRLLVGKGLTTISKRLRQETTLADKNLNSSISIDIEFWIPPLCGRVGATLAHRESSSRFRSGIVIELVLGFSRPTA
jgi:hypothetical protein